MSKIVLLAVAAAWAAVLLPPLLRSRMDKPNSSVSDFRRQLSTLQRTVPTRGIAPMRSIARPLTSANTARPAARQQQMARAAVRPRAHATVVDPRVPAHHRSTRVQRVSQRELVRRRRSNVLFVLGLVTAASLFLAATTGSSAMVYLFVLSFVSTCFYCYKLVQLRSYETEQTDYAEQSWYRAV